MFPWPRFPTSLSADTAVVNLIQGDAEREREFEQRLEPWLSERKKIQEHAAATLLAHFQHAFETA